ncbi:hypothetical protein LPB86_01895 [Pedobacter sp. MC2016-14]|uniref:Crp/Fnr family transcriptional regulator n=1 Tax=Pedobacter sp. MC2016-14 TaxID=2897327 RepID=UPI001E39625F|nr:hypothetical protein [Pedobacter sp. MC2016-14]MCD0486962.1 hypothetical protein [Pedobacter sp. MC2016-14]
MTIAHSLTRVPKIRQDFEDQFINELRLLKAFDLAAEQELRRGGVGYLSEQASMLHPYGDICRKCWFVNEGCVVAFHETDDVHLIFVAGEVVIVPAGWLGNDASLYSLVAGRNTHVIEISYAVYERISTNCPEVIPLWNRIIAKKSQKHTLKDMMTRKPGKEKLADFETQYVDMFQSFSIQLHKWIIASFLHITPGSLSRLYKEKRTSHLKAGPK